MKNLILALALLITGCGGELLIPDCEEFQAGGFTVCSLDPVDAGEVELLVSELEWQLRIRYPEAPDLRQLFSSNGVIVYFLSAEYLAMNCRETAFEGVYDCDMIIGGLNRGGDEILVQWTECLGYSSLAHELLHTVEIKWMLDVGLTTDELIDRHSTPYIHSQSYGSMSVEYRTETAVAAQICQ